ncbi:OmpA family protein [Crocinitomix sp.]|nr:OmpA family protein [Crocinitomix sp.]
MKNSHIINRISITLFILFLGILSDNLHAQKSINGLLNDAKKQRANLNYPQSIKLYKESLIIAPANSRALEGLVEIYLYQYEIYDSAEVYILERMHNMSADTNAMIFYDYANCLRLQERHEEAIEEYLYFKQNYLSKNKYSYLAQELNDNMTSCRYAVKNQSIINDNVTFTVQNMDFFINSVDSEYTPVYIEEDNLLLYNARYKDFETEEVTADNKYYENIYYFDLNESVASSYNPGIKQDNHHAVVSRRPNSNEILVFYQNKIWLASLKQERLNKIKALPEGLNKFYFQPHGVFSEDGRTLIFSAMTRPEVEGGDLNIYVSYMAKDSSWTAPQPISPLINTSKNEDSPFLSTDAKTLYFSSKGHNSSGGYDFYKSEFVKGEWTYPENLGYPMNSAGDDIYLSFTKDGKSGFFSSNRKGGFGGMDIYSFQIDQKTILGVARDKKGNVLPDVTITLINEADGTERYTTTDQNGKYEFQVDTDLDFKLLGEKAAYFDGYATTSTFTSEQSISVDLQLEKDPGISIYALVTDKSLGTAIDSVKMAIIDNMTGTTETVLTTTNGDYRKALADKKLNDRGSFNFTFEKAGYLTKTVTYNTSFDKEGIYNVHEDLDITLEKIEVGKDLSDYIDISPIYFDVSKSDIRTDAAVELDKIVKVMNENPEMTIELGTHTDSRVSASANLALSEKRAQASANYIKERISNPERIFGKGFGESRLVNGCSDGVKCTEEQHQENRRTEFIITRF